jgi:transcriptional regulator with XRE-family HTH domain
MARRAKPKTLQDLLDTTALSLEALADAAGVARKTLYNARNGRVPRRATLVKLAPVLKVDVATLRAACEASRAAVDDEG